MALATQLRCEEYQQAQSFAEEHPYPQNKSEAKLYSIAHDVMSAHRDRNFQDLHLFYAGTTGWPTDQILRIFDLELIDGSTRDLAYQFGPTDLECNLDNIINLAVWRGHMMFLYPSSTTRPTAWSDWENQAGQKVKQEWRSWSEWMDSNTTPPQKIDLYPCRIFSKLRRVNTHGKNGTSGSDLLLSQTESLSPW